LGNVHPNPPYNFGAGGRTRTGTGLAALRIFIPLRLSPPPSGVRGLDYPFTLARSFRCCPSSLYTFPLAGAWLGIASEGFPDFEQFYAQGFPQGTQWLKSDASTSFATPA